MGSKNHPKNVSSSNSARRPFFSGDAYVEICSKNGQKLTFDRKVVETPFFTKMIRIKFLKDFPIWNTFDLKCFLDWFIGQLVMLGRISQSFTMSTPAITDI